MVKKIAIFGSTGMTGLCALNHAIKKDLEVTVLIRDEAKVPENIKSKLNIIVGDVTKLEDVKKTVAGQNGVVVVLGTRNDLSSTTVMSDGMKNIIQAMKEKKVEIVSVCLSAFIFYEPEKIPPMFHDLHEDHLRMYEAVKSSELKWIAVCPPHIGDGPNSDYTIKHNESPGRVVSKHDLGAFLVDCLDKSEHYQKSCGITSAA